MGFQCYAACISQTSFKKKRKETLQKIKGCCRFPAFAESLQELREVGFSLRELKEAGFAAKELSGMGFSVKAHQSAERSTCWRVYDDVLDVWQFGS